MDLKQCPSIEIAQPHTTPLQRNIPFKANPAMDDIDVHNVKMNQLKCAFQSAKSASHLPHSTSPVPVMRISGIEDDGCFFCLFFFALNK
jgi:hypothetical protein